MILSYYIGSKYLSSFFWSFLSIFFLILLVDGSDQVVSMSSQGHSFILGLKNALLLNTKSKTIMKRVNRARLEFTSNRTSESPNS